MFEVGIENVFDADNRPGNFIPGFANRRGLLRFGIEHLKAGIVERGEPDESWTAEVETSYLSESCLAFGYVRSEEYDFSQFKKIEVRDLGKLGFAAMMIAGALVLVAAIVGVITIVGWAGDKFF
jgi:hypothetical protein